MDNYGKRRSQSASPTEHWTDDLPICELSGVGFCSNQRYRQDGGRREEHEFEDQSFHFAERECYLYGVFDGHGGRKAAEFAAQKLPAELLLGQLTGAMDDDQVKDALKQAFLAVENEFFDSIGEQLLEKTLLQEKIAGLSTDYEAFRKFPKEVEKLRMIEQEIASGTTAVVALIYNNKLFVTNVGNSRSVLCTTDSNGRLHVQQLSTDHVVTTESELVRLSNLGLDIEQIKRGQRIGNNDTTRSIGDYPVKGGYKDFDLLSCALDEPVIPEPDSFGGIPIDGSFYFLILMSDGLYKSLEDSNALTQDANVEVVGLVAAELQAQSTINGVCQAVVDRICRYHHDGFMNQNKQCELRDDMTLLLRLFTAKLGGNAPSPVSPLTNFHPFSGQKEHGFLPLPTPSAGAVLCQSQEPLSTVRTTLTFTTAPMDASSQDAYPIDQTDDASNFVESYVDFSEYHKAIEEYGEDYVVNSVQL